jgi:hypothetical protein
MVHTVHKLLYLDFARQWNVQSDNQAIMKNSPLTEWYGDDPACMCVCVHVAASHELKNGDANV